MFRPKLLSRTLFVRLALVSILIGAGFAFAASASAESGYALIDPVKAFLGFEPMRPAPQISSVANQPMSAPTDLFISEYIEGSGSNKAIEIYNGTGSPVDMGAGSYALELYSNGSATVSQSVSLTATIANGDVYVVYNGSANAAIIAEGDLVSNTVINFNGDDAVALRKAGSIIDVLGQIGFDPGTEWGTGSVTTLNHTLVRKSTVCAGDTNGANAFDPVGEWDGFPQDTFTFIGAHTASCLESPTPTATATATATATPVPTFTVTYLGGGNTHGIPPTDFSSPYASGSTVTLLGPGSLSKTGFRFDGWLINELTQEQPGFTFSITGNVVVEALWVPFTGYATVDTFVDGNFTADPVWSGSTSNWVVVPDSTVAAGAVGSNSLNLNSSAGLTRFLSTPLAQWGNSQEWGIFVGRQSVAFTANTQQFFWLYANETTLTNGTVDGYRIAIGDDIGNDEIRLEHVVNGAVSSTVITSSGAIPNGSTDIGFLVRVKRSAGGVWEVYTSPLPTLSGTGAIATDLPFETNANVFQGFGFNSSITPVSGGFIGVAAQSGSEAQFDQIFMTPSSFGTPATRLVAIGGTDTGNCVSAACATIKYAILQAFPGDTVSIAAGTYGESNIIVDKAINFVGAGAATTIVSRPSGAFFRMFDIGPNNPSVNVSISGLTINRGHLTGSFPSNPVFGAGIRNFAELTITNSSITNNELDNLGSGAGIHSTGNLTVNGSTLSGNLSDGEAGAIKVGGLGQLSMNNSTVSGNTADFGAGLHASTSGVLTITNSTITNNTAPAFSCGGIDVSALAVIVGNTIIAGNPGDDVCDAASVDSNGYNLVGSGDTGGFSAIGDQVGVANPLLGPLANNGGPTFTHALLTGSPAIDKGSSFGSTTDQRGLMRPFDDPNIPNADDGSDIGAYEEQTALSSPTPTATATSTPTNTPTATSTPTATPTANITGNVDYAIVSKPVPDTQLDAAGGIPLMAFTDSMGNYALSGFGGGAYTVTPSRTAQPCLPAGPNGIFSNDAALISQHVVGLITLTSDQLIAADVSNFHAISSFDAALIAQKVVGICGGLNHSGEWVFSPASVPHPGGVVGSLTENYRAVMIGDVSGDWDPMGPQRPQIIRRFGVPDVKASVPVMTAAAGSEAVIPFRIDDLGGIGVGSYQFDLIYDPSVITPAEAAASITGAMDESLTVVSNSPEPGLLKVAVYGSVPVYGDGVYVNLTFKVTGKPGSATPLQLTASD